MDASSIVVLEGPALRIHPVYGIIKAGKDARDSDNNDSKENPKSENFRTSKKKQAETRDGSWLV